MTELTKPVTREIPSVQIKGRTLVVALEPPDKLRLHLKGQRQTYTVPVDACFWLAAKAEVERQATMHDLSRRRRRRRRKEV